jgi:ABC-type transporter Mla MlaB component
MTMPDLSPLELHREKNHLRFSFVEQAEILAELPRDFEQLLADRLADILHEPVELTAEVQLKKLPGLNSRQLGSLIALQKVLRTRIRSVRVSGASESIRHLLVLTHLDQLFVLD